MKKRLSVASYILILIGVIYVVSSVITALIANSMSLYFTGFGFYTFVSAVTALSVWFFGGRKTELRSAFFNTPIYIAAGAYFLISGILALKYSLIGGISLKAHFITQLILFTIYAVVVIITSIANTVTANTSENVEKKNEFIRLASSMVSNIEDACTDRPLKKKLEKLAEDFKYSKPTHDANFTETENKILGMIDELDTLVSEGQFEPADAKLSKIKNELVRRNNGAK